MELNDLLKILPKLFPLLAVLIFALSSTASAMPEIFPLDQVKSGMRGKAYTVVDNSGKIEQFDVSIVGLTDDGKGSKRMIMAEASGEVIRRTGGILQGMSGSPVYIDGKLVGALAATLKEMSPYTFFITPIENMIELWNLPDPKDEVNHFKKDEPPAKETSDDTNSGEKPADSVAKDVADVPENGEQPKVEPDETQQLGALYLSGFDSAGAEFLRRELQPFGLKALDAPVSSAQRGVQLDATLEPGSALGVAIVYGDFSLGSTGTVTAVDGKKILAFGHPFTHAGNVNYFMTDASVIGSVSGVNGNGMKLAGIGYIIGRINQDREAGVSGILGTFPAVVPITVTVHDTELNKQETFNATIAYNENLVPKLGASIAYTALSKMADSLAESTVDIDFNIKTDAISSGEIARKNMFYNPSDVGQVAVIELMQALNLICSNTAKESNIFGVNVNISFDTQRRTASIVSVTPEKKTVKPGETVNLTVELQPYRKPVEKVVMQYTVPLTARKGILALDVHGGALVPANQTPNPNESCEDKINNLLKAGKNNQLVIDIGSTGEVRSEKELRADIERAKRAQERLKRQGQTVKKVDNRVDTRYIIDNVMRTTLTVEKV
ncbi:MAG: SpoIVB peptidase S55 domain protein [Selenomonadaceae bacterium]|nr:SpoIVB peptidase S55 domain protein [Selenomonadaceae bacterium]